MAVSGAKITVPGACNAVSGAHIGVLFAKKTAFPAEMAVFPARHDVLARIHPFPEPLRLAMPWAGMATGLWP